ncbi:MAG: YkgJ family cysteine cluster protein [Proteobacteria bacterium]|nr:YkgJ family cysteine cluster protein [Pseudomonadota bacterium]
MENNTCMACGACCAYFRVSFPDAETNVVSGRMVPLDMTLFLNSTQRYMKGTQGITPRCIALEGKVGFRVKCTIYGSRPSICQAFKPSWENNIRNIHCDRARGSYGLQPFSEY